MLLRFLIWAVLFYVMSNLYLSKARTGSYDALKASGGMYLYEPPISSVVSLLLFKALVETLDRPKSASYRERRET